MKLHHLILVPLAATMIACGGAETAAERTEDAMEDGANTVANAADRAGDAMGSALDGTDAATTGYFQETISAVQGAGGDITAMAPAAAVSNIDGWIARLKDKDGTYEIVQGLENLKGALTDDDGIDGQEVGTALNELAEDIREKDNAMLAPLANALAAGGDKLGGM